MEQSTPASLLIFDAAASVSDLAFDDLDLDVSASAFFGFRICTSPVDCPLFVSRPDSWWGSHGFLLPGAPDICNSRTRNPD